MQNLPITLLAINNANLVAEANLILEVCFLFDVCVETK